ncbi:hypothetical protein pclt_cds_464 [Pandoravirus celtis]|uniref:Ankyrin repeat domain containing protein n=1 Tax=Pandoravirus celtis TaxID=2568002 RepID=A0A4D6EIM9_9VIRU|nr:hypothetical protein pclt_cds_464 [Pandoravirus celtis]
MSATDRKRGSAHDGCDPLAPMMPGRKRQRADVDHLDVSPLSSVASDPHKNGETTVVARLKHIPDSVIEAIVDSLDDRDFGACMVASRLFWVCSKARARARLLSKTLTPDEAVLLDDPVRVLDYMRHRRGVRFRPHHLRVAAKHGRTDAVRWLVDHADWHVDDASTIALWLANDGMAPLAVVAESDVDACYETCRYDGPKRPGEPCPSCGPSRVVDQRRTDGTTIRVPLCLCAIGDAAAKRGHRRALDVLLGARGYGHTDFAVLLAAANGHTDMAEYLLDRGNVAVSLGSWWPDDDIVSQTVCRGRVDLALRVFEAGGRACSPEVLARYVPDSAVRWRARALWTDTLKEPDYYGDADTDDEDEEGDRDQQSDDQRNDSDVEDNDTDDPIGDSVDGHMDDDNDDDDDDIQGTNDTLAQMRQKQRHNKTDRQAYAKMRQVLDSGLIAPDKVQHAVDRALVYAVSRGRMALVRLLHEKHGARLTDDGVPAGQRHRGHNHNEPVASAAVNNDVRMLAYMVGRRGTAVVGPDAMDDAARRGALAALTYLADHSDARPSPRALKRAASAGHAATASFLCVRAPDHCRIGPALRRALAGGHNTVTAILLEHASAADVRYALQTALGDDRARLCRALALRGDLGEGDLETPGGDGPVAPTRIALALRQLSKAQGQSIDAFVACVNKWGRETAVAAYANHAVQDSEACNGRIDLLRVLLRLGLGTATHRGMSNAVFNGHVSVMRLLHDHYGDQGPWVGHTFDDAVANGHIKALVFMHDHFAWAWWSADAVDRAAAAGRLNVVRFLYARRSPDRPWCTTAALDGAIRGTHWRVAAFLHAAGARCTPVVIDKALAAKRSCCCLWLTPLMEAIRERSLAAA